MADTKGSALTTDTNLGDSDYLIGVQGVGGSPVTVKYPRTAVIRKYMYIRCVHPTTDWPADGSLKVGGDFRIMYTGTLKDIWAYSDNEGTTGTAIVDVNLNGATIMTTNKLKWDSTEKATRTYSGTAPALTTTAVIVNDIITVDVDTNHTTKSKGLTVVLEME